MYRKQSEDAKVNSALNKIDNTLFYAGDMKRYPDSRFHKPTWPSRMLLLLRLHWIQKPNAESTSWYVEEAVSLPEW